MADSIGLDAKFNTRQFSAGITRYLKGLQDAQSETAKTAAAINASAQQIAAAWQQASAAPSVALLALQQLTNSIQTLGTAIFATGQSLNTFSAAFGGLALVTNNLTGQLQRLGTQYNTANRSLRQLRDTFKQTTTASLALATAIGGIAVIAFRRLLISVRNIVSEGVDLVRFFERSQLALNFFAARSLRAADDTIGLNDALAQTQKESRGLLIWLQRIAVESPFTSKDVVQAFRVAQAYGLLAEDARTLIPLLLDLGAAVGLDPQTLENAARALGQIQARGKLTGEEIRQLGNAGIPIRDILIKQLGIATTEFDSLLEAGSITADVTIPAIVQSLREFEGAGKRVAFETIGGMISAFAELKQVGTARLFEGIFEPLRKSLLDLIEVANNIETIALFRVMGEDIGNFIKNGIERLIKGIQGTIKAWRELDPELKRAIVTFTSTAIVLSAAALALGAFALAARLLIRPVTILIVAFAAFNTAWKTDILSTIAETGGVSGAFATMAKRIIDALKVIVTAFSDVHTGISNALTDTISVVGQWGGDIISAFAGGMTAALSGLNAVFSAIASTLSFWLAPGSPPRVAPDIDRWGYQTMFEYRAGLYDGIQTIYEPITSELKKALKEGTEDAVDSANLQESGASAADDLVDGWLKAQRPAIIHDYMGGYFDEVGDYIASQAAPAPMTAAGEEVANLFWEGFADAFPVPIKKVNEELNSLLDSISGGRELTLSGAAAINNYIKGFEDADFSAINDIAGIISGRLSSLATIGEIGETDVPKILSKTREELVIAIEQFREFGEVTESQFKAIRSAAGPAGEATTEYLRKYIELASAASTVDESQKKLNETIEFYSELIDPIQDKLDRLREQTTQFSEQREIISLTRTINNEAASALRREEARSKIEQIRAEQRVRNLQSERDEAVDVSEKQLEGAKDVQSELENQLDVIRGRFKLQNEQLSLVADEQKIIERINKEIESLRKKEESQLDIQIKFARLLNEEERDRLDEARARYTLNQADSTEFEKQQALLQLQTIELNRQRRDIEATDLGFDAALFQPIRDAVIVFDDLNIKEKEAGQSFEEMIASIESGGPNATELADEWATAVDNVAKKYDLVKEKFGLALDAVNEGLPDFLKLFPTEKGEEPPILGNLKKATSGILLLSSVLVSTNIIIKLGQLKTALQLLGVASLGSKILGVFGAIGGGIGALASAVAGLTVVISLAVAAWISNFLNFRTRVNAEIASIVKEIVQFIEFLQNAVRIIQLVFSKEGRQQIKLEFGEAMEKAKNGDFSGFFGSKEQWKEGGVDLAESFVEGANQGLVFNPLAGFRHIINEGLNDALKETDTDTFATEVFNKTDASLQNISDDVAGSIANVFSGTSYRQRVIEEAGKTGEDISQGVLNGLILEDVQSENKILKFRDDIINKLKEKFDIQSPSKIMEDIIGIPIGEGVISGINKAFFSGDISESLSGLFGSITEQSRIGNNSIIRRFTAFNTSINLVLVELAKVIFKNWNEINKETVRYWNELALSIIESIKELAKELPSELKALKEVVVGVFKEIRYAVGDEVVGLTSDVVGYIVTNDDSMIARIRKALIGTTGPNGENNRDGVGYQLGISFTEGIAAGINDPTTWESVVKPAIQLFVQNWANEFSKKYETGSPSQLAVRELGIPFAQGIALGIIQGTPYISGAVQSAVNAGLGNITGFRQPLSPASIIGNIIPESNRTYNYNLNVSSSASSQGVINDFSIMRILGGV